MVWTYKVYLIELTSYIVIDIDINSKAVVKTIPNITLGMMKDRVDQVTNPIY